MKGFLKSLLVILMLVSNGYATHKSENSKATQNLLKKSSGDSVETPEVLCAKNRNTMRLFPHPKRSTKFFLCVDGIPIVMNCPLGESFNPTLKICERTSDNVDRQCSSNNGKNKMNNAKHNNDILENPTMDNIANLFIKRVSSFQNHGMVSSPSPKKAACRNDNIEPNSCKSNNTTTTDENCSNPENRSTTTTTPEVECDSEETNKKTTATSKSCNTTTASANCTTNTTIGTGSTTNASSQCGSTNSSSSSSSDNQGTSETTNADSSTCQSKDEDEEEKSLLQELLNESETNTTAKSCASGKTTTSTTPQTTTTTANSAGCLSLRRCRADRDDIYFLPHIEDDRKYVLCDSGRRMEMLCPEGRHFNPSANFCESSSGEI